MNVGSEYDAPPAPDDSWFWATILMLIVVYHMAACTVTEERVAWLVPLIEAHYDVY